MADLNLNVALNLAEAGLAIFPCGADKRPLIKWRDLSSAEPEAVAAMWRHHPDALPAIDLAKAGLFVLDGDRHGGPDGVAALRALLKQQPDFKPAAAPTVHTMNGGAHVYFLQNGHALGNSPGDLPAGIDVRGSGGYTIAPGAALPDGRCYRNVAGTADLAETFKAGTMPGVPAGIVDLIQAQKQQAREPGDEQPACDDVRARAWAETALEECVKELSAAKAGRNNLCRRLSMRLGRMIASKFLGRDEVELALLGAMTANRYVAEEGEERAADCISRGIDDGLKYPHEGPKDKASDFDTAAAPGQESSEICLTLEQWLARDIAPPDFLLGEILSTTSRVLLVGPTGFGKTNFAMAMGFGMAAGTGFLHWRAPRRARVLYIDGEMSRRLMKQRLADAARRQGEIPDTFFALCRDDIADLPPLNTVEGQTYIDRIVEKLGGIDFIFFDNVMSLLTGDMKEEESWRETLPWIKRLTQRSIGQCWIHHTGHDQSRSYGTSTREWQLDTVALLEAAERFAADIAFAIRFSKARERAPHNRSDFEPAIVNLSGDKWTVEVTGIPPTKPGKKPSPKALAFHTALVQALIKGGEPRPESVGQPSVTQEQWTTECTRRGLIDHDAAPDSARALMSKYRLELIAAGWAVCAGNFVWNRAVSA